MDMTTEQTAAGSDGLRERRDAVISHCGRYRYDLRRQWDDGPIAVFVMLNPSTADAEQDDPTIRRCRGFAKSWGMAGFKVVNLFAYRTPSPDVLLKAHFDGLDIVGPRNDVRITNVLCEEAKIIVAAWGATKLPDGMAMRRDELSAGRRQQTAVDLSDPAQYDPTAYAPGAGDTCGHCHHRVDQHDSDGHGECWGDLGLCRCGGAW